MERCGYLRILCNTRNASGIQMLAVSRENVCEGKRKLDNANFVGFKQTDQRCRADTRTKSVKAPMVNDQMKKRLASGEMVVKRRRRP
jgi:hypothetical protein